MKIFTNKNLIQKLVIALVVVTLLNFCIAPVTRAESFGGKLFSPMKSFLTTIGDIFITLIHWGVTGDWVYAVDDAGTASYGTGASDDFWVKANKIRYPRIQISPELIFGNKIEILSIDFIGAEDNGDYILEARSNGRSELRTIISSWYVTLRTIAIVGLLSVLIYVGIRIIISSTSQDKAKYKQRLIDWLVAFVLLFFMHYIMAATVNVVGKVDDLLAQGAGVGEGIPLDNRYGYIQYTPAVDPSSSFTTRVGYSVETVKNNCKVFDSIHYMDGMINIRDAETQQLVHAETTDGGSTVTYKPLGEFAESRLGTTGYIQISLNVEDSYVVGGTVTTDDPDHFDVSAIQNYLNGIQETVSGDGVSASANDDGSKILYFINYARLYVNAKDNAIGFGFLILYIVLIVFTAMFMFRYVKRVIYVAFLTLIAPLVALTYPLDKIKDRKSTSI